MRVKGDTLVITSPWNTSRRQVEAFIESNQDWIEKQKKKRPVSFEEGMSLSILEQEAILQYGQEPSFQNGILTLCNNTKKDQQFLISLTQDVLLERLEFYRQRMNLDPVQCRFGFYRSKWGSCTAAKRCIRLNAYLIFTTMECIDAIVVHELAHLKVQNHSNDFYVIVEDVLPDYRQRIRTLNAMSIPRFQ